MPKFYVSTGDFQVLLSRQDAKTAAYDAFEQLSDHSPSKLGIITIVSEHGFNSCELDDYCFSTLDLLEDTDQLQNYKLEDWVKDLL
jgi:hypothetical protein